MSRYYKPNNSTILYLNSSFNCIKSNSITITKTGNGAGYTAAPTVIVKPAPGDMGSGAAATIAAPVSGVLSGALTMVSNGRGYNSLPTIELSGGGNPGTITGYSWLVGGSGYILPPTITTSGGGGPSCPAANIYIDQYCSGYDLIYEYTDGECGIYGVVQEYNSFTCGYNAGENNYCDCGFGCEQFPNPCYYYGCNECLI